MDTTLFIKNTNSDMIIIQIYVDDIVFGATNPNLCKEFEHLMQGELEISMVGELSYFLRLYIQQKNEGIFINQVKYVKDLLKKYSLEGCKKISTPMAISTKLDADKAGKTVDQKTYRGMIGSLLYLTVSRPDIQFSVYLCARFQANPKESHLIAVKRIFRYLSETINVGLWYLRGCEFTLHAFSDANYLGCKLD